MSPTMIIMPSSRKMTFQSMPSCSEKNTSSPGSRPRTAIAPAATSTGLTLLAFSVAMKKNAVTKIASARTALMCAAGLLAESGEGQAREQSFQGDRAEQDARVVDDRDERTATRRHERGDFAQRRLGRDRPRT